MAIRVPNLGLGDGKTGDTELKIRQDYNHNFSDQTNAASRLVGTASGNVMEVGAFGFGGSSRKSATNPAQQLDASELAKTQIYGFSDTPSVDYGIGLGWGATNNRAAFILQGVFSNKLYYMNVGNTAAAPITPERLITSGEFLILGLNTTKDANGFLKSASPVVDMYDNKIELNHDAQQQGGITFEKLGIGDYLVKGSLGFAQEGWYIETPKDANGNVLVAVVYEQLANNDLSIKTYAKKFDDETGDVIANLLKPRDIPTGRFISLRLHELPKEPPVMPTETQPEV